MVPPPCPLAEFGIIAPQRAGRVSEPVAAVMADEEAGPLPPLAHRALLALAAELHLGRRRRSLWLSQPRRHRRRHSRRGSGSDARERPVYLVEADAIAAKHLSMASASASWANGFANRES